MTTMINKLSLLTAGTALLAIGSISPANAFQLKQFDLSGTTGNAYSQYYPEYQNANFTGYVTYDADGLDQNPNNGIGQFPILGLFIKITNPSYPSFTSKVTFGTTTSASITQDEFIIFADDAQVENSSLNNPTLATLQLFFDYKSPNPDSSPTEAPPSDTFKPTLTQSYLTLKGGTQSDGDEKEGRGKGDDHEKKGKGKGKGKDDDHEKEGKSKGKGKDDDHEKEGKCDDCVPDVTIPITSASVTGPVAAVPEPTTMVGASIFGVGLLLKRRSTKSARK